MNLFAIVAIVNTITGIVLGLLVLLRDMRKITHIAFFLFTAAIGVWSTAYFFWQIATTASDALFFVRILMTGAIFIPFFYYHFVTAFIQKNKGFSKTVLVGYGAAFFFGWLVWTSGFVAEVSSKLTFEFWPTAGPLFLPFLMFWGLYAALAAVMLARELSNATGERRAQLQYMLLGTVIGYLGGATNYFLWFGIPIAPYGNISASIYIVLVAYAILKHRLFNLKVIATEFLTFALWLFIFVRMLLADTVQDQLLNGALLVVTIIVGTLLIRSVDNEVEAREHIEKLAENLEKANERLREMDRQKSEFLSMAAHQLRTPLAAIKGYTSLMLDGDFGALDGKVKNVIHTIFVSSSRMVETVADFLDVSRIEQGRMEYRKQHFDVGTLACEVAQTAVLAAKEKKLELTYDDDGTGPYTIYGDDAKIQHVIGNLIDNAIKYTEKGRVSVHVKRNRAHNQVQIAVADTGCGIPADALPHLFDKFVRARNAKDINVTGTGLGLYVAREMVRAHDGSIRVRSAGEGQGSIFIIDLPLAGEQG